MVEGGVDVFLSDVLRECRRLRRIKKRGGGRVVVMIVSRSVAVSRGGRV